MKEGNITKDYEGLQLLETSGGNVIGFRKKTDSDKMSVITFFVF